jgi:hypothetical protein
MSMSTELEVLADVSGRLESLGVPFMLTGSFALAFYATPRMTRDLDIVVSIDASRVSRVTEAFGDAYYVDADMIRTALASQSLFNLMHYATGVKIDLIVRKSTPYRIHEFARRREVQLGAVRTWIVSAEDLILSKLVWARESGSDMQLRDVQQLMRGPLDVEYLRRWAKDLDVVTRLESLLT